MEDKKEEKNENIQAAGDHFVLEIDSDSRNEEFARVVTAVFLSRLNPTLEELDDVKTAVSEAVTNAVIHGYEGKDGTVRLEGKTEGNIFTIQVQDQGKGIVNIKRAMEPMFTTDTTGERSGMGFSFMEAFMDQVQVESEPGKGTTVTMKKKIGRMSGRRSRKHTRGIKPPEISWLWITWGWSGVSCGGLKDGAMNWKICFRSAVSAC